MYFSASQGDYNMIQWTKFIIGSKDVDSVPFYQGNLHILHHLSVPQLLLYKIGLLLLALE